MIGQRTPPSKKNMEWNGNTADALEELSATLSEGAMPHVDRLRTALCYAAPEIRVEILWTGRPTCLGLTEICRAYGTDATAALHSRIVSGVQRRFVANLPPFADVVR